MSEEIVESESQGFFSRLGGAIGGIFVGIIMILVAFPLLFWNEGRAVNTHLALQEGASSAVHVDIAKIDPANEGNLVHVSGAAATDATLSDPTFGVSVNAIALRREVEMYQWKENVKSKKTKKTGGGTTTTKTYSYEKDWFSEAISSGSFKESETHQNPGEMLYDSESWRAETVTLGAFTIAPGLASSINNSTELSVTEAMKTGAKLESQADKVKIQGGRYYFGTDPASPTIGDQRVSFKVVKPGPVSALAKQKGNVLSEYKASNGYSISALTVGTKSMDEMFEAAESSNNMMTWVLRFGGFGLMFMGISAFLGPIRVFADIIPFVGSFVGFGIAVLAFFGATMCTLPTIAVAWLAYRPILAMVLLTIAAIAFAVVVLTVVMLFRRYSASKAEPAAA